MAHALIKYAIHKNKDGTFQLGFDNLNKAEAHEYLTVLMRQQDQRAEQVVDDGAVFKGATTDEVAAALGVDAFPKADAAPFDHKYEPGALGTCKRCGGEKH